VISAGAPWELIALVKNLVAAFRSRLLDTNTSMTCPYWSTARYGTVALSRADQVTAQKALRCRVMTCAVKT